MNRRRKSISVDRWLVIQSILRIIVAAMKERCSNLQTFNVRPFTPTTPDIIVQQPSGFLITVRSLLGMLHDEDK